MICVAVLKKYIKFAQNPINKNKDIKEIEVKSKKWTSQSKNKEIKVKIKKLK